MQTEGTPLLMMIGEKAMAKEILRLVKNSSDIDERLTLYMLAIPEEDKTSTEMYLKAVVEKASIEQQSAESAENQLSCVNEQ